MLSAIWQDFLNSDELKKSSSPVLQSLLKQSSLYKLSDKKVTIACRNSGVEFFFKKNSSRVKKIISGFFGKRVEVEFVVTKESSKKKKISTPPLLNFSPSTEELLLRCGLNPVYRFENFAVSSTNQIAYAAAQAVVDNLGKVYNPLFLYGGVGVGKTHLAQAVARRVLEKHPKKRVLFSAGDQFTNELIDSIREKNTRGFRKKYRKLHLLIIDDIQFIAGKRAVQEEFFHTFNSIISSGGQIILTSDQPPYKIKRLEDRLRSRFSGGLIIDIQPPDFELRTAILLIKAKEKNIPLEMDAAKIIAEKISDTRALEGVLLSIYARVIQTTGKVDKDSTLRFFKREKEKKKRSVSSKDVISTVCTYYNVKIKDVKGKSRTDRVVIPRQVIMYFLREYLNLKFKDIAYLLSRKDHTTIIYGVTKIKKRVINDPIFKEDIDKMVSSLNL